MLPKPKFDTNLTTKQLNNGSQIAHNWFQCSVFESQNKLFNNQLFSNNNNNQKSTHFINNSYNNRNDGQNWQKSYKRPNNYQLNPKNTDKKFGFNCDSCCRWFHSEDIYKSHLSEHIVCGLDECKFSAHQKVIASHQRMQHFSFRDKSVVKKFMSLDTPEDIAKWREERRQHFPTKDNIKKKAQLMYGSDHGSDHCSDHKNDNQFDRKSNFKRNKKFNRFNKHKNNRNKFNRNYDTNQLNEVREERVESNACLNSDVKKLKLDSNTANDIEEGEIVDSDRDSDSNQLKCNNNEAKALSNISTGALTLLSAYDSSDESESDIQESKQQLINVQSTHLSSDELPQKSDPILQTDSKVINTSEAVVKVENNCKKDFKRQTIHKRPAIINRKRKLTLYEKLLMTDIQNNEEEIMECIKLIVDNNFLQK